MISRKFYWLVYPAWIALCALLFVAFSRFPDPSQKSDRIPNEVASERALRILKSSGSEFADYEVVHVSYAKRNEVSPESRWLVLCDRNDRTALRDAFVVHLRAKDGALLEIRELDPRYAGGFKPISLPAGAAAARVPAGALSTR